MKKSTKGAIAAGAAGVLLLGGAGSLAYWSAEGEVGGSTINSGSFTLTEAVAGTCAAAPWTLDSTEVTAGATFAPAADHIVPGDVLTKKCDFTLGAVGNHLRATPTVTTDAAITGTINPAAAGDVTVAGTFSDAAGDPITVVTEDNNTDVLTAKITMTFPLGTVVDNASQNKTAILSNYKVTLNQVHN